MIYKSTVVIKSINIISIIYNIFDFEISATISIIFLPVGHRVL